MLPLAFKQRPDSAVPVRFFVLGLLGFLALCAGVLLLPAALTVPPGPHGVFLLRLEAGPDGAPPRLVRTYAFTVPGPHAPFAPLRHLPAPRLDAGWSAADRLEVENRGAVAAVAVHVACPAWDVDPDDFTLLPGERRSLRLTPLVAGTPRPAATLEAMGLPGVRIGG